MAYLYFSASVSLIALNRHEAARKLLKKLLRESAKNGVKAVGDGLLELQSWRAKARALIVPNVFGVGITASSEKAVAVEEDRTFILNMIIWNIQYSIALYYYFLNVICILHFCY